ncbi:GNAT family N-acetyltransferase [Kineosporia sp. A_224]|uniref:GNAT family N-acetyltransferase n=1 Tax=Kineosporia sp. A_224 TaxID=1962180 RepID=UPI000B4B171A|nr:GNAT family N-acetyltransferase [Kineosporia sp. A_224]
MDLTFTWRGEFTNAAVNTLHAEAFGTEVFSDDEWDWQRLVTAHSLGWVTARDAHGLVGFVNVLWDGLAHAWLQDVMVARRRRHQGVGRAVVDVAETNVRAAGCEWLHVDFTPDLAPFYLSACGFEPAQAGVMRL